MRRTARIECFRIERTVPIQHLLMLLVTGIGQRLEIVCVSINSADILGRTSALPFQTLRICHAWFRWRGAFEEHIVDPAVAEVVMIFQGERPAIRWQD